MIFLRCSIRTRKSLFELSKSYYNIFIEFIWGSLVNGRWLGQSDLKKKINSVDYTIPTYDVYGVEKAKELDYMPIRFVTNILDAFLVDSIPGLPWYSDDEFKKLSTKLLVTYSSKEWLSENKEKLIEKVRKTAELGELILNHTEKEEKSKIDCFMLLWMNNCINLTWDMFQDKIYNVLCKTCDDEDGVKYFQFLSKKFGDDLVNREFIRKTEENLALRLSCQFGRINMVRYLKNEFGLTKKDVQADDNFALRLSCENGHILVVKYLKEEFGLTKEDAQTSNALDLSCSHGHLSVIKYLKEEFGMTKEDAQANNNVVLTRTCFNGHLPVVKYLKEEFGLTKKNAQGEGNEALFLSCRRGHLAVVKYLKEEFGLTKEDAMKAGTIEPGLNDLRIRCNPEIVEYLEKAFGL